jgi:hypothetical protein
MVKKGTFRLQVGDKEVVREAELLEHATLYYKTLLVILLLHLFN